MKRKQDGFSIVELVLVVVLLGIIGFVLFRVYQAQANPNLGTASTKDQTQSVPTISKAADLDVAAKSLDQTNVGDSDLNSLDSQLNF